MTRTGDPRQWRLRLPTVSQGIVAGLGTVSNKVPRPNGLHNEGLGRPTLVSPRMEGKRSWITGGRT